MMTTSYLIRNATAWLEGKWQSADFRIENGRIAEIGRLSAHTDEAAVDAAGLHLFPGFIDMHVHFRSPGFEWKETIETGSAAAARGGYTAVCTMPNLKPVPDRLETLEAQRRLIARQSSVHILPYGAITEGEGGQRLANFLEIAPYVVGFTDDGVGVDSSELIARAMVEAKAVSRPIVAHCEVIDLVRGGCIHDGEYARRHGLPGNPSESEWRMVERDIRLAEATGCAYHICHISTKESVGLLREARRKGLDVTGETAPHYLIFNDADLKDSGAFKMNPPIRGRADQQALLEAVADGTILCIATDHAPHTAQEKSGGLLGSLNGVVGLETAFAALYTHLVMPGRITLEALQALLHERPLERFRLETVTSAKPGLPIGRGLAVGEPFDATLFDLNDIYVVDAATFASKGKASPFAGQTVHGRCMRTFVGGETVYQRS